MKHLGGMEGEGTKQRTKSPYWSQRVDRPRRSKQAEGPWWSQKADRPLWSQELREPQDQRAEAEMSKGCNSVCLNSKERGGSGWPGNLVAPVKPKDWRKPVGQECGAASQMDIPDY